MRSTYLWQSSSGHSDKSESSGATVADSPRRETYTNKQWDTVFPNAACAVALIDRLTHHAEIISIDGESYRKREAEQAQKRKQEQKPKR